MPEKQYLTYIGDGPGQAHQIARCGYVFTRELVTEVDPETFGILVGEKGFKKSTKKEIEAFERAGESAEVEHEVEIGPQEEGVTDG